MNRLQYWVHEFMDRWDDLDVGSKIRMLRRYPRKKLIAVFLLIVFILYVFYSGESKENPSTVKQCVNDRLLHWSQKFDDLDIGVEQSAVDFVGNGYVGVDSNGEMRFSTNNSRVLDLPTGFYPFVTITSDAAPAESLLTDFKNGVIKRIQCFPVEGECACLLNTIYAHRTRKGALVQEIQITNPTRASLNLNIERRKSIWQDDPNNKGLHHRKITKNTATSVISAVMCSTAPGQVEIPSRREDTYRLTCSVSYIESKSTTDISSVQQLLSKIAVDAFSAATSVSGIVIDNEHAVAWNKIHNIGFRLSHSKAPQVLNSDRINSTKYAVLSNIRAPHLEVDADEFIKKNLANISQQRERCYSGHSNLLFPSRLWEDIKRPDQLVKTADVWLLTLDKRGCSSLLKSGASGFAQAFVLSLTACSFHDGHLEMGMAASDLHREMAFSGIPIGNGGSTVTVEVKIGSDNRPYLEVSATDTLFACDGGCLDEPITLGKTFTRLPIKVTKPATSILYVASSRKHLEQLRSTIHVSEVGAAPAHEDDILSLHRTGSRFGGLPTSFWVFLGVLLIAFHAFLAKLLWRMTNQELLTSWNSDIVYNDRESSDKIVPQTNKRNILITSALPYVNNVPHLGNIIGCVLSGDCFSRYCRLRGHQVLYICGTDEYGTATETKALQEGLTPRQICDKYHALHKAIYEWFNIDFDHFGRTTTDYQTEITQDIFLKLHANGFTTTSSMDQLYCENCCKFLADRFVTGTCPTCAYDDARGDQCDGCGKLMNAVELKQPKCHMCKQQPIIKQSTHIFLQLDKLQEEVNTYVEGQINRDDTKWSANAIAIIKGWVKKGLEKRCITRDLKWGIPVPLAEFEDKVFYVWFDAPIGYLSITKELLGDNWTKWWKNPKEVELFNFLGKDNVAFHGIMFPSSQIGARDNYTIVNNICATEYLNYEDTKFSKSRGVGVFGNDARETGIEPDVWRFYLLYMRPENQDTAFSWDDFALKVNSELLANLGNFVNRALSFLKNNFNGIVPEMHLEEEDFKLLNDIKEETERWDNLFDNVKLRDAVRSVLEMSRRGNKYMQDQQPWALIKGDDEKKKRAGTVIGVAANIAYHIAIALQPIMPEVSQRIREQCNLQRIPLFQIASISYLKAGHKIGEPKPLFVKIEAAIIQELKKKFGGNDTASVDAVKNTKDGGKKRSGNSKESKKSASNGKAEQKMATVSRHFPQLCKNQQVIKQLLESNKNKFEQARSLFVKEKLAELEKTSAQLEKEVAEVSTRLVEAETAAGKKQIPVPKREATATSAPPTVPAAEKSATVKEEKAKNNKKEEKGGKKEEKGKTGAKKGDAAADDSVDVGRIDLRVGRIVHCEKHPDADALYLEKIDVGEAQPRTVISGLVKWVPLEQMQNRLVVVMCNLKPAKMRGIESQAMVMCASSPEKVEIMEVNPASAPGTPVLCPPYAHRPDSVLNPKKKVWETVAEDLKVSPDGVATWKGQALLVGGSTKMTAPTLRNVNIK